MTDSTFKLTTPVAFIIFNRPDTTKRVFEAIREAKPEKLYLISDAPREGREDDEAKVAETRAYVEEHIDWECQVKKNYATENMGCKMRVSSGITWVLEQEEDTIILEDDVLPNQDFFRYCQEMLEHFRDNKKIMMISGVNLIDSCKIEKQYTFSCFSGIWGWATWARAWKEYDVDIKEWPEYRRKGTFKMVQNGLAYMFLKKHYDEVYNHTKDTWDYQWDFCRYKFRGLGVVPRDNMIENIGMNHEDATNTLEKSEQVFEVKGFDFPINYDVVIKRDVEYDRAYIKKNFGMKRAGAVAKRKVLGIPGKIFKKK